MGLALAGPAGPGMRGDGRVLVKEHHAGLRRADPEGLPDEPVGRAVEGALEDHVPVGVELRPFPDRELIGRDRERLERGLLHLGEALERALLGGPMEPLPTWPLCWGVAGRQGAIRKP